MNKGEWIELHRKQADRLDRLARANRELADRFGMPALHEAADVLSQKAQQVRALKDSRHA